MVAIIVMSGRSMKADASAVTQSMLSRAKIIGVAVFLMVSEMAIVVAEFLEKSPMSNARSASEMAAINSGDLSKEPEIVDFVYTNSDRGGSFDFSASGRTVRTSFIGSFERYSEFFMMLEKFCELPPRMEIIPVFCSGIFHKMSSIKTPILLRLDNGRSQ